MKSVCCDRANLQNIYIKIIDFSYQIMLDLISKFEWNIDKATYLKSKIYFLKYNSKFPYFLFMLNMEPLSAQLNFISFNNSWINIFACEQHSSIMWFYRQLLACLVWFYLAY